MDSTMRFSIDIQAFEGRISDYFHGRNPDLHPAGRVFFHLVENRNQAMPFAFMATYSAGMGANGKPKHLPLNHAIASHDDEALLNLLSTVYKAGEKKPDRGRSHRYRGTVPPFGLGCPGSLSVFKGNS